MSILEKNIKEYKINLSTTEYKNSGLINDADEDFLYQPNFDVNRTLFLVYELTSIKEILKLVKGLNEKSIVFLYYRDERYLHELLSKVDFVEEKYRILFFAGNYKDQSKANELDVLLASISYSYTNIQPIIKRSEDIDYIRSAREFLEFVRNFRNNYNFLIGNDLNDTLIGIRNRLLNMPYYVKNPGFEEFKEKYGHYYANKPAVIVSSGPSLDKNVHLLKDYRDKMLVLSCDGSLAPLEKHGIKPDIVGSVEREYLTYTAFYRDRTMDDSIIFSGPAVVRPEIIEKFDGKNILSVFKDKDIYGQWMNEITLNKKGVVWAGSSVAHFLLSLADGLGCDPIMLIGQDLAYSLDGVSHAGETEIKETIDLSKVTEWVKDYDGNDIPSTTVWKNFLTTFEDMIRKSDKKIIDATEGGALIKGSEIRKLKDALEQYCKGELPIFNELVNNMEVKEEYVAEAKESSFAGVTKAIRIFEDLLKKVQQAQKKNQKSIAIVEKGIETQKQLDGIYDTLEFVDNEIVKHIAKDAFTMMLFQYPIFSTARAINSLTTDKFTLETIAYNLQLHFNLLETFNLYLNKMIRVLITGLKENNHFYSELKEYEGTVKKLTKDYAYLYKSDKYDITLV